MSGATGVVVVEAVSLWIAEAAPRPSESLCLLTSPRSRDGDRLQRRRARGPEVISPVLRTSLSLRAAREGTLLVQTDANLSGDGGNTMPIPRRRNYSGPAILSYGFRPFFLAAAIYSGVAIVIWLPLYSGEDRKSVV